MFSMKCGQSDVVVVLYQDDYVFSALMRDADPTDSDEMHSFTRFPALCMCLSAQFVSLLYRLIDLLHIPVPPCQSISLFVCQLA